MPRSGTQAPVRKECDGKRRAGCLSDYMLVTTNYIVNCYFHIFEYRADECSAGKFLTAAERTHGTIGS